ncbi:MAG: tetratricopeptide repeat protein [Planctomyces sp.]|nr:tetratricopeptide repeat protein [Planctomyces sp.]
MADSDRCNVVSREFQGSRRALQVAVAGVLALLLLGPASQPLHADAPALAIAREHLQRGRYDEAAEQFAELQQSADPTIALDAAIGMVETHLAEGEWDRAEELLAAEADRRPDNAALQGRMAELQLHRGRDEAAERAAQRALDANPEELRARLVMADLKSARGQVDESIEEYRWFVRHYNQRQPRDAETLLLVARGAVEYARARGVAQIYNFVINDLAPDALKADPLRWEAAFISGSLLIEKYNHAQAVQEFNAALAINPRSADVLAGLGRAAWSEQDVEQAGEYVDRALAVNARHLESLLLAVDLSLLADDPEGAEEFARRAREINPTSQSVLYRLAAIDLLKSGMAAESLSDTLLSTGEPDAGEQGRAYADLYADLLRRNAAPGEFLTGLGSFLEHQRRWDAAARCYARAIEVAPQLSAPRTSLGLLKMRTGELADAREILDVAFKADPFHVRVSNMRKVLGVLEGYETLTTEHFVIRYDRSDRLQAEFLAEHLESVYGPLTSEFGYEPPVRTPFELYSSAKGQGAHAWFSARMVGLPWIQTIGASTGMIVAMSSPTASREPYNWARVATHEFSHVLTLQQSGFAIPHWYTEALAVRTEGDVFPDVWRRILRQRADRDDLFTLDTLNQGFQRPRSGDDWQLAYCQSRLYARYMEETYGAERLFQLVDAYRRGLKTPAAIREVFDTSVEEFEAGFSTFLTGVLSGLDDGRAPELPGLREAEAAARERPDDADARAELAWAVLNAAPAARAREARELCEAVLVKAPDHPVANAVLARLEFRTRKSEEARARLERAFRSSPHPAVVGLLGRDCLEAKDFVRAAEVFDQGLKEFPNESGWLRGLAVSKLRMGQSGGLKELMLAVSKNEPDDVGPRLWLMNDAAGEERWEDAIRWGTEVLQVDVRNVAAQRQVGAAWLKLDQPEKARRHLAAAAALDADDVEAKSLLESLPPVETSTDGGT